ncbi:MAG: hypothetical protein R3A44_10140 [Caldilineaceae bacterium]
MKHARHLLSLFLILFALPLLEGSTAWYTTAFAQRSDTLFTYQGYLELGGPVSADCDFSLQLYNAEENGEPIGDPFQKNGVDVRGGVFTLYPDFGIEPFKTSEERWLETTIVVCRSNEPGLPDVPVTLSKRVRVTKVPGALSVPWEGVFGAPALQQPISVTCGAYQRIAQINSNGTVTCEDVGDITAVNVGTGLNGGGSSGNVTLSVDFGSVARSSHSHSGETVFATTDSPTGRGVDAYANSESVNGPSLGVRGKTFSKYNAPSIGNNEDGPRSRGVEGVAGSRQVDANGNLIPWPGDGEGVAGFTYTLEGNGVYGRNHPAGTQGALGSAAAGVFGVAGAEGGQGDGVLGFTYSPDGYAVYGRNYAKGGKAAWFDGDVAMVGSFSKSAGSFKIDHPLDPANKYLNHSFVESPDMMNIYNGNVLLDQSGESWVQMPAWFEALNMEFRYQLTPIGAPGPNLFVAEEIQNNRFKIAGGTPGMKVSWQVTGIRHDPYADAHRIQVEEDKPIDERGRYLHPTEYAQVRASDIATPPIGAREAPLPSASSTELSAPPESQ